MLSNWFYPIMNCEGPAEVWDHKCQQLIKNLGVHFFLNKDWRDCMNVLLHSHFFLWPAGEMYQRTLELIDFQM